MARLAIASVPLWKMFIQTFIFCAILASAFAGPTGGRRTAKCALFCKDSSKFTYEPGKSYYYDYSADVSTSASGGSNQESRIHLKAKAEISAVSTCELVLQLQDVTIEESLSDNINVRQRVEGSEALADEVVRLPLRFSFQDGKVEHLCAAEDESTWSLNIKRGILSTLQNSMENMDEEQSVHEADVNGRCQTTYTPLGNSWAGSKAYKRIKDLGMCNHRHSHFSAIQAIPYTSQSMMQTLPLMNSRQECTQNVLNGRIERAQCEENHTFQPFQQEESGAQTTISQLLVFEKEIQGFVPSDESLKTWKTTLLYQNEGPVEASEEDIMNIMTTLQKLEADSVPEIKAEAPEQFINLVESLRLINVRAMQDLFTRVTGPTGKKFLLDAMPLVASAPSLVLMRDLLLDGRLTEKQIDAWLTSLIFIKNPTIEMLAALKPLVDYQPRSQAFLGVSAMVNSYCKANPECTEESPVEEILDKFFSYLGNSCEALEGPEELSHITFALKAIGNAGRLPTDEGQRSMETLQRCFSEKSNPTEVRLAALDAFRRMPCDMYDHQAILNAYSTFNENTEVRIKAYLIAMQCADRHLIDTVKDVLYTDAVNQVSSFVWTHLTNLQETASPDKQTVKELLSNEFLKNKFNTDVRKYSRNYEGTFFSEKWNAGASTDSNVIFTPDSFLPRSGMFNLTVHLFGNSVNLLEVGIRLKQLEHLLEPIFGPHGYFPDQRVNEALHSMRPKRDVSDNRIERLPQIYSHAATERHQPTGSIYTRVFGHEVMYKNFDIGTEGNRPSLVDETGRDWMDIKSILTTITSGNNVEYKKSTVFLDATYTVPTGAGIPLSLSVQSAATIGITANGKFDVDKFWDQKELEVKGLLRPSAAVQIDGVMSTKLGRASSPIRSGMRLQNTLHSSTAIEAEITAKGAKIIRSSISLPQDRQEIFTAKSQLLILRPSGRPHVVEQGPVGLPQTDFHLCKGSTLLGLEICTEVKTPQEFTMPLATPTLISLYARKTDTIRSYDFNYEFSREDSGTSLTVTFDTPGSTFNRRIEANFQLDPISGVLDASVATPVQSFRAQGKYSNREKSLQFTASAGQQQILLVNAGVYAEGNRLTPNLLVKLYNRPVVEFQGTVDLLNIQSQNGRANAEFVLKHLTETPVQVRGDITRTGEKFDSRISVESYLLTGNVRSQLRMKPGYLSTKAVAEYSWQRAETKSVDLNAKFQRSKQGVLSKVNALVSLVLPDTPDSKFDASIETQKSPGYCESSVKLAVGKYTWEGKTLYNNQKTRESRDFALMASLKSPRYGWDYSGGFTHNWNQTAMITRLSGQTDAENAALGEIEYLDMSETLLKKSLTATATWPEFEYSVRSTLNEVSSKDYVAEVTVSPNDGSEMKTTVTYKDGSNDIKLDHLLTVRARGLLAAPLSGNLAFSASDRQAHLGAQLDIEGNGSYSGRWSTSADYRVVKNNMHKLEGKLTLNDRKYNGEISFRQAKNGDRVFTLDAQGRKHLSVEATMNGDLFGPLSFGITVYPDKKASATSKFSMTALISSGTINVKADNFGQKIIGSFQYDFDRVELDCNYEGSVYKFQANYPAFNLYSANITLRAETPIDSYRTMLFTLNHRMTGTQMDSKIIASIEDFEIHLALLGSHAHGQTRLLVSVDLTDAETLTGQLNIINRSQEKQFHLTTARGNDESSVKVQFVRNEDGFSSQVDFRTLSSLPQFHVDLQHQINAQLNSNLNVEWTMPKMSLQRVTAQLTGATYPLNARFSFTSPWTKLEQLEGSVSFQKQNNERELSVSLDGQFRCFPIALTVRCKGNRGDFRHEIVQTWMKQGALQTVQFTSEGHYATVSDAVIKTTLTLPQGTYEFNWTGEQGEDGAQKYELDLAKDRQHYLSGMSWGYDPTLKHAKASVWCEPQDKPRFTLSFENIRRPEHFLLQLITGRGQQVLFKTRSNFRTSAAGQWDLTSDLDSVYDSIPRIKVSSRNAISDGNLQHKSQLILGGKETRDGSRGVYEIPHTATAEFNLREGRHFDGQIAWNEENVNIRGELQQSSSKQEIQAELTSTRFSPVSTKLEILTHSHQKQVTFAASSGENSLISLTAGIRSSGDKVEANLDLDCSLGHHITATVALDKNQNQLEVVLTEDRSNLIDIHFLAKAQPTEGNLRLNLTSSMHPMLEDTIRLAGEYRLNEEYKIMLKYEDSTAVNSIQGSAAFNSQQKFLQINMRGAHNGDFKAEIQGMGNAETSLVWNSQLIFETKVEVTPRGDERMNYHDVKIVTRSVHLANPFEITTAIGYAQGKVHIQVQTPVSGWTSLNILGELHRTDAERKLKFVFEKERNSYSVEGKCIKGSKGRQVGVKISTPWQAYSSASLDIEYERKHGYEGKIQASINEQMIKVQAKFAPKIFTIDAETPFKQLRKGSLSANWNLSGASKNMVVDIQHNTESYNLQSSWTTNNVRGEVNIVFQGFGATQNLDLSYDVSENFSAFATLSSGNEEQKVGGRVVLNKQTIEIEGFTPLTGYERFYGKAGYENLADRHHSGNAEWRLNGKGHQFNAEIKYSGNKIQLKASTSIPGFENFILDITHSFVGPKKELSIQGQLNEAKPFKFSLEGKADEQILQFSHPTASSSVKLVLDFPMEEPLKLQMLAEYDRRGGANTLKGSVIRNGEKTEGNVVLTLPRSQGFVANVQVDAVAPAFSIVKFEATGQINLNRGVSSLVADSNFNEDRNQIRATFQASSNSIQVNVDTTFGPFRTLRLNATNSGNDGSFQVTAAVDEQQGSLRGRYHFDGIRHTKLVLDLATPFEGLKSIHSSAEIKFRPGSLLTAMTFQNDKFRYVSELEGSYANNYEGTLPPTASIQLVLKSPVYRFENLVSSFQYSIGQESSIGFTFERNTKREINAQASLIDDEFNLNLNSTTGQFPLEALLKTALNPFTLTATVTAGSDSSAYKFTANMDGARAGAISAETPLTGYEHLSAQWSMEGDMAVGKAQGKFNLPRLGQKSLKTTWKTEDWQSAKLEILYQEGVNQPEKRYAIQYALSGRQNGNGKIGASVIYTAAGQEQQVMVTTSIKRNDNAVTLDGTLKTPYPSIREALFHGKLVLGHETSLDLSASLNENVQLVSKVIVSVSPKASKLKFTFSAPALGEPFSVNAAYDVTKPEKVMEISFIQNKYQISVRTEAKVPQNSNEIELHMSVDSNVPLLQISASGSMKAGYLIDADGTRRLTISVNSDTTGKWDVTAALRPSSDFYALLEINSPRSDIIQSSKTEIVYTGNMRQGISSYASFQLGQAPEIKVSFSVSMENVVAAFTSGFPGYEDISFEAKLETSSGHIHKRFQVQANAMGETIKLKGFFHVPSRSSFASTGELELQSSWDNIPNASLQLQIKEDGTGTVQGVWGQSRLTIRASLQGAGRQPWRRQGTTRVNVEVNSEEFLEMEAVHFVGNNMYSLNITVGENYQLDTFLQTDVEKVVSARVQWNPDQTIQLFGKAGLGRFETSISTPWTSQMAANGMYNLSDREHSAKGYFIYGGQRSALEANAVTTPDVFDSSISIDIPALHQKFDTRIKIRRVDDTKIQGNMDVQMADRRLSIEGELDSKSSVKSGRQFHEKSIKVHMTLPSTSYPRVSTELNIQVPKSDLSSLKLDASLSLPSATSKGTFGYEVPIHRGQGIGVQIKLDSPYVSNHPVEFSVTKETSGPSKFEVRFQYEQNDLHLSYDTTLSKLHLAVFANVPELFESHNPIRMELTGTGNWPSERSLKISGSCSQYTFSTEGLVGAQGDETNARFVLNVPVLLNDQYELTAKIQKNVTGHYLVDLTGLKGMKSLELRGEVTYEVDNISASGRITGTLGNHFVQIKSYRMGENRIVEINGESAVLLKGRRFKAEGKFKPVENGFEVEITCRTRSSTHSAKITSVFTLSNGSVRVTLDSPTLAPFTANSEWSVDSKSIQAKLTIDAGEDLHQAEMMANIEDLESMLRIQCPMLLSEEFSLHGKAVVNDNAVDFLGDAKINGAQWRLEGMTRSESTRNMEVRLELRTPFDDWERLTFAGKSSPEEILAEVYTPLPNFPNAMFRAAGFPVMALYERPDITLLDNTRPVIVVALPWMNYTVSGVLKVPQKGVPGEFGATIEYGNPRQATKKRYEALVQVPSLEDFGWRMENPVKVHMSIRMPKSVNIQWEMGGRLQWKTWAELNAMGELNGQKVEFESEIRNEEGNRRLSVTVTTPFQGYERYVASLRLENYQEIGRGRTILLELQKPEWENPIRMEIDYRYRFNGLTDMDAEITVAAPRFVIDFPPLSLHLRSAFRGGQYNGAIEGSWKEMRPSLKIEAGTSDDSVFASVEGIASTYQAKGSINFARQGDDTSLTTEVQYGNEQILLLEGTITQSQTELNAQVSIVSPFQIVRTASAELRLSPLERRESISVVKLLDSLDIGFGLTHNAKKIFQIELVSKNGRRSLEVFNPIRPVSVTLTFERVAGHKLRVLTELCWNLKTPAQSTLALEFGVTKTSASHTFNVRFQAGELGGAAISILHLLTSAKFEQAVSLRVINPGRPENTQEVGYSFCLNDVSTSSSAKYDFTARIDTPWRSIGVEASQHKGEKETIRSIELKWDVLRDVNKRIGLRIFNEKVSAGWKSRVLKDTITVVHTTLPDNFVLAVERTFKNQQLHSIELVLQPSRYPQDYVTIAISKENMGPNGAQVILSHPSSNMNIRVIGKRTSNTAAVGVSYMDINGDSQEAQISFSSDASSKLFEINAGKDLQSILKFEIATYPDRRSYNFRSGDIKMDINVVKTLPYMDMTLQYDANRELYVIAGLPHTKEISFKVWRKEYGMNIQDVQAILRLNASEVFSSKLDWRPELSDELYDLVAESGPRMMIQSASRGVSLIRSSVSEEIQGRWSLVEPNTRVFLENFAAYTYAECSTIYGEFEATVRYFGDLYERNRFYMKDVGNFVGAHTSTMLNGCITSVRTGLDAIKVVASATVESIIRTGRWCGQYVGRLEQTIMTFWDGADEYFLQMWKDNVMVLSEIMDRLEDYYDFCMVSMEEKVEELERRILAVSWVRKLVRLYENYASWVEELPGPIQEVIEAVTEFVNERICKPMEEFLRPYYDQARGIMENGNIQAILNTPPFPYLRHVSLRVKALGVRFWNLIEAEQRIKEIVAQALHALDGFVRRNMPTTSLTWEVEKGHIEFHHPLTLVKWNDFTTLPAWKSDEDDAHRISQINTFYYEILDTIRSVRPAFEMNLRDILPPFGAHAVMAGDYHYYTFDKKYFRFAGECSYVLAADLLHQNFSLLVNYESSGGDVQKKSYTLVTQRHSVDIDAKNLKVTLDGRKVELPLEVGPTFIRRMPNGIEIFDTRGFQMTCNQSPALCTISVSGWYFGKMAGLLGTYDNEQSNDMRTPDGEIVTDVANFAHSWRVGENSDSCRMKNMARHTTGEPQDADGFCSQHFDDASSLLRPCFTRVNTTIFKEMCLYDTARDLNRASRQESACTAISAYVAECQKEGVDIWLPPPCIRCSLEVGTKLTSGESAILRSEGPTQPPNSTDVVILLEEAACLTGSPFAEAMRRLDLALRAKGMTENRYALVGFGGQGPHRSPHIRTTAGQIWTHNTLFRVNENIEMNGDEQGDLYDAIEFASRTLKFRAGVAKTMIAMTCGSEQCGSASRYPDTITLLMENDIKLHLLTPKEFTAKGNKREGATMSSKIYGMDSDGVYTLSHAKDTNLEPENSLKRLLNLPKDLCTPLAIESNGTRFVFPKTPKKSLEVWSRRVAKTAEPASCQRCECIPDKSGSPHVVCQQCISPRVQEIISQWEQYRPLDDSFPIEFDLEQS